MPGQQAQRLSPVGCFWDYENLPPSSKFHNSEVGYTAAFRELAQQHGAMKTFKAYLEVDTLKPHRRDALQSMGLTLLDCPHRGKKEVADKMMIVDMILFAIDNPAPATVIVASTDRDYQYAISMLRLRQYTVIVLTKDQPHPSMVVHSTPSIDW
ncbi:limkain-b1-type NYN domain-containing protein, partial [Coprinopsis sp. MPI-PUGE-AT-0042]